MIARLRGGAGAGGPRDQTYLEGQRPAGPRRWTAPLAALAVYTLLGVVLTWPLALSLTSGVVGAVGGVDAYQGAWGLWWTARALSEGRSPLVTPLLYYPHGADLFWQTLGVAQGIAAAPATLLLGPQAGFNLTVLSSYALGGLFTFLLARRATGSAPGALVAGAVFVCSPYHLEKVLDGNLEVAAIQWLPLYALALLALLERPRLWRALLAGGLLLWLSLGSWYYALFALMFTGLAALLWGVQPTSKMHHAVRPGSLRVALCTRTFLWGLVPIIIWAAVLSPRILDLAGSGGGALMDMRGVAAERSADLVDFVLPNPRHPLWGDAVAEWRAARYPDAILWNVALGWVGIGLALAGLAPGRVSRGERGEGQGSLGALRGPSHMWRWWALLAATLVLAMGPELKVAGAATGVPLPYALIQDLPGVRAGQRPNHMVVFATLALAVLAAHGFVQAARGGRPPADAADAVSVSAQSVGRRIPRRAGRRAWLAAVALAGLAGLVDGWSGPMTVVQRPVHPFYAALPPPDGAIAALPLLLNINRSDNLTPQTVHGWPILGGYVARPPRYDFPRYAPGVRELEQGRSAGEDIVAPGWPESGRRALAAYGIRYVTLSVAAEREPGRFGAGKAEYFAGVRGVLRELGAGAPLVADADLEAYAIPREWPVGPVAYLGAGWQPLERQEGAGYRWRWMGERAEVRLYNPLGRPVLAHLTLRVAAYGGARPLRLTLGDTPLGGLDIPPDSPVGRSVVFFLPPGDHTLALESEAALSEGRAEPISVRVFELSVHH